MPIYDAIDPQGKILNEEVFGKAEYPKGDILNKYAQESYPSAYKYAKTFVSTDYVIKGGNNGITSIDDPTYLGFSLRFDILSPLFNGAMTGNAAPLQLEGFGGVTTMSKPQGESAVGYLDKIGEPTRAMYLKSFIQGLDEINKTRPYYWQTIEGLSEAWNKSFYMLDPFNGSSDDEGITIGCLEALDLKISALFNLYRAAVYDVKYNRTVLPINLMYFDVYIDVYEIRKFKTIKNKWAIGHLTYDDKTQYLINENTAQITFKFSNCIWDVTAANKVFDGVTNAGGSKMAETSIKWSYSRIELESQFPGYSSALDDSKKMQYQNSITYPMNLAGDDPRTIGKKILDNTIDATIDKAKEIGSNAVKGLKNKLTSVVKGKIQSLLLGNVFDLRNRVTAAITNPMTLTNALAGAAVQVFGKKEKELPTKKVGDNAYGRSPSGPSPLNSTNVYD